MFDGLMIGDLTKRKLEAAAHRPGNLILYGRRGSGMAHCADELAKAWLMTGNTEGHPDLIRVDDAGKTVQKETVMQIIASAEPYPVTAGRRVIIIDDAERLSAEGQNALLKTLEELTHNVFIFVCHGMLLATVESRCMRIEFSPMPKSAFGEGACDAAYYGSCGTPGAYAEITGDTEFASFLERIPGALLKRKDLYMLMGVADEKDFRGEQFFTASTGRQLEYFWNFVISGFSLALCGALAGRDVPETFAPLLGLSAGRLLSMKAAAERHRVRSAVPGYSKNDFYSFLHEITREEVG